MAAPIQSRDGETQELILELELPGGTRVALPARYIRAINTTAQAGQTNLNTSLGDRLVAHTPLEMKQALRWTEAL